jgi:hypothetical protein
MAKDFTDQFDFLDALADVIRSADPDKRAALRKTIDGWAEDFPDYDWATGPQSPALLNMIMVEIDASIDPDAQSKPRPVFRLVDRKPHPKD